MNNKFITKLKLKLNQEEIKLNNMNKDSKSYKKQRAKVYKLRQKTENRIKNIILLEAVRTVEHCDDITIESLKETKVPFNIPGKEVTDLSSFSCRWCDEFPTRFTILNTLHYYWYNR